MNVQKVTCTEVVISIINKGKENPKQKQFNKCSEFSTDMGRDALKNQCFGTQMAQTCQISGVFGQQECSAHNSFQCPVSQGTHVMGPPARVTRYTPCCEPHSPHALVDFLAISVNSRWDELSTQIAYQCLNIPNLGKGQTTQLDGIFQEFF